MTDGPTLDQPDFALADCGVWDGTNGSLGRPMTVDDLIGLVKQLPGVEEHYLVASFAEPRNMKPGWYMLVPIPEEDE